MRFAPLSGLREELAALKVENARTNGMIETMQALFDAAPLPMWVRDADERLIWVNDAYAKAVDAPGVTGAVTAQTEFLNEQDRTRIAATRRQASHISDRLSAVVEADRRNFHVVDAAGPFGAAGSRSTSRMPRRSARARRDRALAFRDAGPADDRHRALRRQDASL